MTATEFDVLPPPPPPAAIELFGDRLPVMVAYAEALASSGIERGLVGPREVPRLWQRHILNCGVMTSLLADGEHVVDVGSGAGLPGLVIAIARPDLQVTLVEPLLRRVTWLNETIDALSVSNVECRRGRAEAFHGSVTADVVTARAVASLSTLVSWCLPLARPGGRLLALKGRSAAEELEAAAGAMASAPARDARIVVCGAGLVDEPATVIEMWRHEAQPRRRGSRPLAH